nr:helix-turn-helix domain-containing protein [Microvirga sp. ACRRW]
MEVLGHLPVKKPPRKRSTEEKPEASPASAPEQTPRTPETEVPEKEPLVPFAYSISEAARMAGIGKTKLYEEVKEGRLPLRKVGRKSLIFRDDLMKWLNEQTGAS